MARSKPNDNAVSFVQRSGKEYGFFVKLPNREPIAGSVTTDDRATGFHWMATAEGVTARGASKEVAVAELAYVITNEVVP